MFFSSPFLLQKKDAACEECKKFGRQTYHSWPQPIYSEACVTILSARRILKYLFIRLMNVNKYFNMC